MRRLTTLLVCGAVAIAGCSSDDSPAEASRSYLLLQAAEAGHLDGIVDGTISIVDDCVLLKSTEGDDFARVIWPSETEYLPGRGVLVTAGGLELVDGDPIRVGGGFEAAIGEYSPEARQRVFQEDTFGGFAETCRADVVTQQRVALIASLDPPTPES